MIARSGRGQSSLPCIGGERKPGVLTLALGAELHLCHCHQSRGCPSGGSQRSAQRTAEGRPGCASEQSARRCRRAKCCNGDSDNLVRCFWTCLVFLGRSTLNVRYVQDGCNLESGQTWPNPIASAAFASGRVRSVQLKLII